MKKKYGIYNKREEASDALSMGDFNKLIDELRKDKEYLWELYCRVSYAKKKRANDVIKLRWRDLLYKDKIYFIEKKTRKNRGIPINQSVKDKFIELYELLGSPDKNEYFMINKRQSEIAGEMTHYTLQYINRKLKIFRVRYRLNISRNRFSSHSFRKTFGRYVYESNGKSFEALNLLNMIYQHANIATTQRYLGIQEEEIDNIYNQIKF